MDTEVAIANHAGEVESLMLQGRRSEKDFLLRKDTKYLGRLEDTISELKTEAEEIVALANESGNSAAVDNASEIITLADEYAAAFKELVHNWELKGLDHKSGLQGEFRAVAGKMAITTGDHAVDDLNISLLSVRRYEKDFVRTGSDKYKGRLMAAINTYKQQLAESECGKAAKNSQEKALNAYSGAFEKYLVAGDSKEVQVKSYELMRSAAGEMEKALNEVHVAEVRSLVLDIRKNEKDYLLRGDTKYVAAAGKSANNLIKAFEDAGVLKEHLDDVVSQVNDYKRAFNGLVAKDGEIAELTATMRDAVHKIEPLIEKVAAAAMESATAKTESTVARAGSLSLIALSIAICAVLAGVVLAIVITRGITGPLDRIIAGLTEGSDQVSSAAGQVSSASQSLAEGATEQAAGLEETSSSLEEMASMTKQNADNAQQANTLASDASKAANTGNEKMGQMNTAIQDIQKSSDETAKIIKVIDEIAFQTNLLALNAAVEAARAGEAGKGFAVVAEEVRNLAMRSAEAAKDTSGMIEESVKNANNGVEIATEVAKVLEEIVGGISKTTDLVGEIAAASQEQSQGIDQVNTSVTQMDKVTQANAANAEESASASEELSAQAEQMNSIVNELSALVGGSSQVNTSNPSRTLKTSDHAFHQIAGGSAKTQTSQGDAEKSIPLGQATDFDGFNS